MSQTNLAFINQRIATLWAEIGAWQAGTAPMLPNAQGAGNVDYSRYVSDRLAEIDKLRMQATIEDGPWELGTQGIG